LAPGVKATGAGFGAGAGDAAGGGGTRGAHEAASSTDESKAIRMESFDVRWGYPAANPTVGLTLRQGRSSAASMANGPAVGQRGRRLSGQMSECPSDVRRHSFRGPSW